MGILKVENSCEDCNYERDEEVLYRRRIKAEVGTYLPLDATDATVMNQPIISNTIREKPFTKVSTYRTYFVKGDDFLF